MLDRTPFLQFVAPRLAKVRQRARDATWTLVPTPLKVSQSSPTHEHVPAEAAAKMTFAPVTELPHFWGRKFQQCWWMLEVPALDAPRYLRWRDQGEATLYRRDGESWMPHFGIDPGHHYAPLPAGPAATYLVESGCVNTGIWVSGETVGLSDYGSRFEGAFLATRDEDQWHAFHDLDVLIDLCKLLARESQPVHTGNDLFASGGFRPPLEDASPLLRRLLTRLDAAADAYDNDGPAAMRKLTQSIYADFPAASWAMKAVLTGHAHIDLVWLWPERTAEAKAVHSFATANTLMEEYPEFHFGYSQPASYEAVERRSPALMKAVRGKIKDLQDAPPAARPAGGMPVKPKVDTDGDTPGPREEADYDAEAKSSVSHERGDRVDPAGPKRSARVGNYGTGGAVTGTSGTTAPVSRSSDRENRTTGKLRDRDLERSARHGDGADINAYSIPTGDSSFGVPVVMAVLVVVVALLLVVLFFSWPTKRTPRPDGVPTAGGSLVTDTPPAAAN